MAVAALGAFALRASGLWSRFCADDFFMLGYLRGHRVAAFRSPLDLYRFADGTNGPVAVGIRTSALPWWTDADQKLGFWRPLPSALMWLDQRLWGDHQLLYRLHSLLWFSALVLLAGLLYRRVLPGRTAAFALLFFALEESCFRPAIWWCNRHQVIAGVTGLLALIAHLRWREERWRPGLALSVLGWLVTFLAGEAAFAMLAYLVAYELLGVSGPRRERLLAVAPALTLAVGFVVVRRVLGCALYHTVPYVDPFSQPLAFLSSTLHLIPVAAADLVVNCRALAMTMAWRPTYAVQASIGGGALLWFLSALLAARGRLSPEEMRRLRWLGIGCALAIVPGFSRKDGSISVLLLPTIGFAACAAAVASAAFSDKSGLGRLYLRASAFVVLVVHVIGAAWMTPITMRAFAKASGVEEAALGHLELRAGAHTLVAITSPFETPSTVVGALHPDREVPVIRVLANAGAQRLTLMRMEERTLELAVDQGTLIGEKTFLRSAALHPMRTGDVIETDGMQVRVIEAREGRVLRARYAFTDPLDDPSNQFVAWIGNRWSPVSLPPVGGTIAVSAADAARR